MKSLLSLIIILPLSSFAIAQFGGGSGTSGDPYLIAKPEQLNAIGADPNTWDKHFLQTADIDLSGFDGQAGRPAFNMIGTSGNAFSGVYDGTGFKIQNFTHNSTESLIGLFRRSSGTLRNLHLINANVVAKSVVGILVGLNEGAITNCFTSGNVTGETFNTGGLAGGAAGTIHNSHTNVIVSGPVFAGGLVGSLLGASITQCSSSGTVTGGEGVGGFAGVAFAGSSIIEKCFSSSNVTGFPSGALIGEILNTGLDTQINDCYATGFSTGFIGMQGACNYISNCYYAGCLIRSIDTFGCGSASNTFALTGCGTYATVITEQQMKLQTTFTDVGWDFDTVWDICDGISYPTLQWQNTPCLKPLDLTGDGLVTLPDLSLIIQNWLAQRGDVGFEPLYDLNNGGSIEYGDLALLGRVWQQDVVPPSVPQSLTLNSVSRVIVRLSWGASSDNVGVILYKIYRDGVPVDSRATTIYTGLLPATNTLYIYQISAIDAAGNESPQSNPVEVIYVSP